MNRIMWLIGVLVVAVVVFLALSFVGRPAVPDGASPAASPAPVAKTVAQQPILAPTPCVPPPGFAKCPGQNQSPSSFDWGESPKIDLGGVGGLLQPQKPTPTPTPSPGGSGFFSIPIIGGIAQGLWAIVMAIDWVFRNLWIFVVAIILFALWIGVRTAAGFHGGLFFVWEIFQTLWTERTIRDALNGHQARIGKNSKKRSEQNNRDWQDSGEQGGSTCADCGKQIAGLPFTPTPGKPVYCPECWSKRKGRK